MAKAAGVHTVNYRVFLQTTFDFIISAFVIFMLVKQVNRITKQGPRPSLPGQTNDEKLLLEIRNALKGRYCDEVSHDAGVGRASC